MANGAFTLQGFETPEEVQARIGKAEQAALVPRGDLGSLIYQTAAQGAAGMGGALAGALGYEDPAVSKAKTRQQILGSLDLSSSAGLYQGAQALIESGDIQAAGELSSRANELRKIELAEKPAVGKAPTVKKFGEQIDGKNYIVDKEWTGSEWVEIGRREVKGQTINLERSPAERARGKDFEKILEDANLAERTLFTVDKARSLLPDIATGKLEPLKTWARGWGDALGIPVNVDKMADAESFNAVMQNAVLDGMAAIKGTASDADRETVKATVAALGTHEDANKFLIDAAESLAKREIEKASFYSEWDAVNGNLRGARSAWNKRVNAVPLIKRIKGEPYHYYQYKDALLKSGAEYFRSKGWNEQQINQAIDKKWREDS